MRDAEDTREVLISSLVGRAGLPSFLPCSQQRFDRVSRVRRRDIIRRMNERGGRHLSFLCSFPPSLPPSFAPLEYGKICKPSVASNGNRRWPRGVAAWPRWPHSTQSHQRRLDDIALGRTAERSGPPEAPFHGIILDRPPSTVVASFVSGTVRWAHARVA